MFPIVSEHMVHRFKFWANGSLQDGMRHGMELYQLIAKFPLEQRQQAYALGIDLFNHFSQDVSVVISRSGQEYSVWSSLRSKEQWNPQQSTTHAAVEDLAVLGHVS